MRRSAYLRSAFVGLVAAFGLVSVFLLAHQFSRTWELGDFSVTFYQTARYFLRGENVYLNAYPHPYNGREYPPFNPIWGLYVFVPFGTLALPVAQALRVMLDLVLLSGLAYFSARWAHLPRIRSGIWLVLAPWLLTQMHSGQLTPLVLLGVLLCYWGVRKPSASITAVGLWLVLSKFMLVTLIVLATILFAGRRKILGQTLGILFGLIVLGSLASPLWWIDLLALYVERLAHPRVSDSILLLPGYPWAQLSLLALGAAFLGWQVRRLKLVRPTPWLWAVMLGASLVGALHSFIYDWQLLMPLLALMLRSWWGTWFTLGIYAYSLSWVFLVEDFNLPVPSLKIVPGLVLALVFAWGLARPRMSVEGGNPSESSA